MEPVHAVPRAKPIASAVIRQSVAVNFLIEMDLEGFESECRGIRSHPLKIANQNLIYTRNKVSVENPPTKTEN